MAGPSDPARPGAADHADLASPTGPASPTGSGTRAAYRERGFFEVRWRQFRRAPRPVVRAVASSLIVALVGGIAFEVYDVALDRGAVLPGGDLRILVLALYVLLVLVAGSIVTWLVVPLPSGAGRQRVTRTPWSAMLGLFAAIPVVYLVLVVLHEILKPLLLGQPL